MKNDIDKKIALIIIAFLLFEFLETGKKEKHTPENEFSHDTFLRTYSTSAASITASAATDQLSISMLRNFIKK